MLESIFKMNKFNSLHRSLMHQSGTELVKLHQLGSCRIIELNRPAQLNSLNSEMVKAMTEALICYSKSPACSTVIIKGCNSPTTGKPIFCAGGDVVSLVKARESGKSWEDISEFFKQEYALNHLIGTYNKPIISFMDGICSTHFLFVT